MRCGCKTPHCTTEVASKFTSAQEMADVFQGKKPGTTYGRAHGDDAVEALGRAITRLEIGRWQPANQYDTLVYASGMAAISTLALHFCAQPGVAKENQNRKLLLDIGTYGGTVNLIGNLMSLLGGPEIILVKYPDDLNCWENGFKQRPSLAITEVVTNPLAHVRPIHRIMNLARRYGTFLAVDNTLLTPACYQPLARCNAHAAIESLTKYANGYSDQNGGSITSDVYFIKKLMTWTGASGPAMADCAANVIRTHLETLPERAAAFTRNALALAKFLERQPLVRRVYYPMLESSRDYDLAHELGMASGGYVLSFEIAGGTQRRAFKFIDALVSRGNVAARTHLGDVQTIVTHPASTTHFYVGDELRTILGVGPDLIRVSVGIEGDQSAIFENFEEALKIAHR